jgi:serine O-acetyltransferase
MIKRTSEAEPSAEGLAPPSASKDWHDADPSRAIPFWASLRDDVICQVPPEQRQLSAVGWAILSAKIALSSSGFKVTLAYRVNHTLVHRAGRPGRVLAGVISRATNTIFRSSIAPKARLHGGLVLPHPHGIMIGSGVVVGPRTWIYQNVTMGGTYGKAGEPTVGADCRIYTNAVIGGPVTVGDGVVVSPNSLVQRSVPSRSMAVGVPANVFPQFGKPKV